MSIFEEWEEVKDWPKLTPVSFHFKDEYWGDIFITCTHYEKRTWAIYEGSAMPAPCLSKKNLWFQYEPHPSERSDEYLKDTRFPSTFMAMKFYMDNKEAIQSTHFKHPKFKKEKA